MQDLFKGINDNVKKLRRAINKRYEVSINRAKVEYIYRATLGRAMADQRCNGMAATALYDYCRSLDEVANLRSKRDIEQAKEDYLTEMIYYYKTEIRIAENQIKAIQQGQ